MAETIAERRRRQIEEATSKLLPEPEAQMPEPEEIVPPKPMNGNGTRRRRENYPWD